MINGAVFLFILGIYVAYKLACWIGEPGRPGARDE